jgi:amino-acid N-acetyltransferase
MSMLRNARIEDVKAVHQLLQHYGQRGELLPRPLTKLYEQIRDFAVYEDQAAHRVVGCCALQFCWEELAEIRSLAVHPDYTGNGIGSQLTAWALQEARNYRIRRIFTLTYRPGFFKKFGFREIERGELPLKIWSDCILCVKFPDCDEIAMLKELDPQE